MIAESTIGILTLRVAMNISVALEPTGSTVFVPHRAISHESDCVSSNSHRHILFH